MDMMEIESCNSCNQAGGSPRGVRYERMKVADLKKLASKKKVKGRSKLTKKVDIITALRSKNGGKKKQ